MSNETTTNQNAPVKIRTLEEKQASWAKFAIEVHNSELELQVMKEALIIKLKDLPYDLNKIESYESVLKEAKVHENIIIDKRKGTTNKLDALKERHMSSEKQVIAARVTYETALLSVKQSKRDNDQVIAAKNAEIARVREFYANSIAQQHADFEIVIVNKIAKAFEQCITKKLTAAAVAEIYPTIKALLNETFFGTKQALATVVYMKPAEIDAIYTELLDKHALAPIVYVEKYHKLLFEKFEFYEIAIKNSEASLAQTKVEQAAALTDIANTASDQAVATKLEAISTPLNVEVPGSGKPLKQVYKLDMEDTQQNAIEIIAAFASNWSTVKDELGVRKWFNLSVNQMAAGLVTLKNKDNRFEVGKVKFVLIDKM